MSVVASIDWMPAGEAFFASTVERATPFDQPSLLPGWDRTRVISHVAGNATGLLNLLRWAATGVETPMYASPQAREEEIERWSAVGPDALVRHLDETRERLDDAVRTLPESAWQQKVQTNSGRVVEAGMVPWMRVREVYVHTVDIDAGPSFADVPEDVRTALVDDVVGSLSVKPDCPVVALRSGGDRWRLGSAAATAAEITGIEVSRTEAPAIEAPSTADLLAWLTGRSNGQSLSATGPLPALPRWL